MFILSKLMLKDNRVSAQMCFFVSNWLFRMMAVLFVEVQLVEIEFAEVQLVEIESVEVEKFQGKMVMMKEPKLIPYSPPTIQVDTAKVVSVHR
jgi:hypothetical protein